MLFCLSPAAPVPWLSFLCAEGTSAGNMSYVYNFLYSEVGVIQVHGMDYKMAGRSFAINGCGFRDNTRCTSEVVDANAALDSGIAMELSPYPEEWII